MNTCSPFRFSLGGSSRGEVTSRAAKLVAALVSTSALLLTSCASGDEGIEAKLDPNSSGSSSQGNAVASSTQNRDDEATATTAADGEGARAAADCEGNTLETSGLHADKIPSYTTYPYSYEIEDNGYDPCAELSFVHLKGVFADERDQAAWESPTSTVIYFHRGKIIKNPAPEMYFRVENPRQVDGSTVTFDLKAPGAEYYMPHEDGGSVTATYRGGGLSVDSSSMSATAASDMRIDLS